jgi:WD40 repeat protein
MRSVGGGLAATAAALVLALSASPSAAEESAFNHCTPTLATGATAHTPVLLHTFSRSDEPIQDIRFSHDGRRIAIGQNDRRLRVWDIESGELVLETRPLLGPIWNVMFTSDGSHVLTYGPEDRDIPIHVWNVASGADGRFEDYSIMWGLIDPASTRSTESRDGRRIFENALGQGSLMNASGREIAVIRHGNGFGGLTGVQFSYDSNTLALAYSYHTRIFDAQTGAERAVLCETANGTPRARMSFDGRFLIEAEASRNEMQNVSVWDTTTSEVVARTEIPRGSTWAIDISPDGSLIAIALRNGETRVYRVTD